MADTKRKSPLYKNDGEKKQDMKDREDEAAKTGEADEKKAVAETAEKVAEGTASPGEIAADKDLSPDTKKMFLEKLQAMHKGHESERRDFHGNMRDQMRQMHGRHAKQLSALFDEFAAPAAETKTEE